MHRGAESQELLALVCCQPATASELAQQHRVQVQVQEREHGVQEREHGQQKSLACVVKEAPEGGGISGAHPLRLLQRLRTQSEGGMAPCTPQAAAEDRRVGSSPRAFESSDGGAGTNGGGSASNSGPAIPDVVQSEPQVVMAGAAVAAAPAADSMASPARRCGAASRRRSRAWASCCGRPAQQGSSRAWGVAGAWWRCWPAGAHSR